MTYESFGWIMSAFGVYYYCNLGNKRFLCIWRTTGITKHQISDKQYERISSLFTPQNGSSSMFSVMPVELIFIWFTCWIPMLVSIWKPLWLFTILNLGCSWGTYNLFVEFCLVEPQSHIWDSCALWYTKTALILPTHRQKKSTSRTLLLMRVTDKQKIVKLLLKYPWINSEVCIVRQFFSLLQCNYLNFTYCIFQFVSLTIWRKFTY